jgi:hypothetical protein
MTDLISRLSHGRREDASNWSTDGAMTVQMNAGGGTGLQGGAKRTYGGSMALGILQKFSNAAQSFDLSFPIDLDHLSRRNPGLFEDGVGQRL